MAVTRDIPRAWIRPRRTVLDLLARGPSERVAFAYLAAASLLGFVSQLPRLVREARERDPAFDAQLLQEAGEAGMDVSDLTDLRFELFMSSALMSWIFVVPILMYLLAWMLRLMAKLFGGQGTGLRVRVAFFFSFLAVTPALLLQGLTSGFVGPGPAETLVGVVLLSGFIWIALNAVHAAETPNV